MLDHVSRISFAQLGSMKYSFVKQDFSSSSFPAHSGHSSSLLSLREKRPHSLQCHFMATPPRARRGNFPARRSRCEIQLPPGAMEKPIPPEGNFKRKRSGSGNGICDDRAFYSRQGKARASQCLFPPGESARSPGNNCCRQSRGPCGRVGAFPAGTGRPRGSAEGCPAGSRPAGAP